MKQYNFKYHMIYDVQRYDFLLTENQFDNVMDFMKRNKIKNDGGFLFGDLIDLEFYCNKIYLRLIEKIMEEVKQ